MAKNSFLHPVNQIHFGTYKPEDVKSALVVALAYADQTEKTILDIAEKDRTYQNTIQALNDSTAKLGLVAGIVGHLSSVIDGAWDKADALVSEKTAAFSARRGLNKKLYLAIKVIWDTRKQLKLTTAQIRLVNDYITSYERSGISLPKEKQTRLKQIKSRLAKLSSIFAKNNTQGGSKAHLLVKNVSDLRGIDDDQVEQWKKDALKKGLKGHYIQWSAPNYDVVMRHCDVQKTRIAFQKVSANRAPKNEKIINETLALRRELAKLLGYKNFVDYVVEQRMAKNSKAIASFNANLLKTFKPIAKKDALELRDFIREIESNPSYKLDPTDVIGSTPLYYAQKMGESKSGVDVKLIREYLPLEQVLNTMFDTLSTLYGVTIKEADEAVPHKDVRTYQIHDENGRHLSTVWCDWYARKGKRDGAWCDSFYEAQRGSGWVSEPHLGTVVTNFTPPTKTKPSLLSIRDTETLWHEFGHFMHVTLGNTEIREQGGFHTKWDFVEAPSQIMENWVWNEKVLTSMARHYKTQDPLPRSIVQKLLKSRVFWKPEIVLWTLYWSAIDQALHTVYDPQKDGSVLDYTRKIKSKFFMTEIPEYDKAICTFAHIFAGSYYGAYYSYQWAEVIEADLFSRFEKEGVLNPKTGRDYRDKVLARGDEVDPDQLVRDFLGRDFNPQALLRRSGLS